MADVISVSSPKVKSENDEQSPYEEVAANVSNKDDPNMSCLTLRSWIIGLLFTSILSFVNQFFWYRTSPLFVGALVAQLLSHGLGKIMAKVLPRRRFQVWRWSFTLNPGPFTVKEHCIVTAMASATAVSYFLKYSDNCIQKKIGSFSRIGYCLCHRCDHYSTFIL